jgi:hypothetical protein
MQAWCFSDLLKAAQFVGLGIVSSWTDAFIPKKWQLACTQPHL